MKTKDKKFVSDSTANYKCNRSQLANFFYFFYLLATKSTSPTATLQMYRPTSCVESNYFTCNL